MKTYSAPAGASTFVDIACDLCGERAHHPAMGTPEYTFVRCARCGVTYQNPQPTEESLRRRYAGDYYRYEIENERNFFGLMLLGLRDIGFERLEGTQDRGTFLDVGCATGMLLESMLSKGWRTKGVEICEESARHAIETRGLDVSVGSLEEAALPSGSIQVAHFSHLLEHVLEPRGFLTEVRRILDPRGYAVITTPNIAGFQARLLGTRWRSAIADHLYLFSPRTLEPLLRGVGFGILKRVTWGGIAKGLAPQVVKTPLDRMAKLFGFGDVMLYLVRPLSS